jgi:aconitate hydratase
VVELDLSSIEPSLAGPKRPQDRVPLAGMKNTFDDLFSKPISDNGFNRPADALNTRHGTGKDDLKIGNGDVLIAAITSCTNTSNPGVLLAAGLLAKKAVAKGLTVAPHIKTSLAPGSRVVTEYLSNAQLLEPLAQLGFSIAAYGCTTCIGNAGALREDIDKTITNNHLICAAVLSGNRNFEARIHPNIKANFLASPPLVVAYAIAGKCNIDLTTEPLGMGRDNQPVYLKDIWPNSHEVATLMRFATNPAMYQKLYRNLTDDLPLWNAIPAPTGNQYQWDASTYIACPPFFDAAAPKVGDIKDARALAWLGDSVTTDHISPAGSFKPTTPAGQYLLAHHVEVKDFNSYGARRGNHEVMMRGTFANVRIKNLMLPPKADGSRIEGGYTLYKGEQMAIFDAAMKYIADGIPTIIFAGEEYGTGSSRDWAAKGTQLLGVKAVIAKSYERIHRSNLVGMGVLPLQFKGEDGLATLNLVGDETFDLTGLAAGIKPQQDVTLTITRADGSKQNVTLLLRIDTPIEIDYYQSGGILPYVLQELIS